MIEVVRPEESAAADEIAATLRDMVVAFREVADDTRSTPLVRDGEVSLEEPAAIAAFIDELRRDVVAWNAFQSDACFIGDDGEVC